VANKRPRRKFPKPGKAAAAAIRKKSTKLMTCRRCRQPMLIGQTGLVCATAGCSKIEPLSDERLVELSAAWPDLTVRVGRH
jgi:hypothetical protein